MARNSDATTLALVAGWCFGESSSGYFEPTTSSLELCEEALQSAQAESGDIALLFAKYELGAVLLYRDNTADRSRGFELVVEACTWLRERIPSLVPITEVWAARETFRRGDRDAAITVIRKAVQELPLSERPGYGVYATAVLVEALLERGAQGDLAEAEAAIESLAQLRADEGWVICDIFVLRLNALAARARGDDIAHRDLVIRYRAMAESLGFEGHVDWAESMAAENENSSGPPVPELS